MHRGLLRTAAFVILCVALALAGSVVALRAAAPASTEVTLGTGDVRVVPARGGEVCRAGQYVCLDPRRVHLRTLLKKRQRRVLS